MYGQRNERIQGKEGRKEENMQQKSSPVTHFNLPYKPAEEPIQLYVFPFELSLILRPYYCYRKRNLYFTSKSFV